MPEVVEFRRKPFPGSRTTYVEPFVSRLVAQGNSEITEIAAKADAESKKDRAVLNRIDKALWENLENLDSKRNEFESSCGSKRFVPPLPFWAFFAFGTVMVIGEWAILYELLDYLGIAGSPRAGKLVSEYFSEAGYILGAVSLLSDLANDKAAISLALAYSAFALSKSTGTHLRQFAAGRPGGMPSWLVVALNVFFVLMAAGFAFLREASVVRSGYSELEGMWPVFMAVQAFVYAAAVGVSAWMSCPDPESECLSREIDSLLSERALLWIRREAVSSRVCELIAKAHSQVKQRIHRIQMMVADYRDNNFAQRNPADPVPEFMKTAIDESFFRPLELDPLPEPPAVEVRAVVGRIGSAPERYEADTENERKPTEKET